MNLQKTYLVSALSNKCPRCREGELFVNKSAYSFKGNTTQMNETCPVCHQPTEIEVGFYYGTGYVSYAPVSYTHLDVYKRQILYKPGALNLTSKDGDPAVQKLGSSVLLPFPNVPEIIVNEAPGLTEDILQMVFPGVHC